MLKSWERECVGVWVCGYVREREMLKCWERECVGMGVCGYVRREREKLKTEMLKGTEHSTSNIERPTSNNSLN
jgi:hypothetical protein